MEDGCSDLNEYVASGALQTDGLDACYTRGKEGEPRSAGVRRLRSSCSSSQCDVVDDVYG